MELSERLQQINEKLLRLQLKLQALEQDNTLLESENNKLKIQLQSLEDKETLAVKNILEHAEQEDKEGQAGKRAVLDQDIHQQIDHYLSEIDTCIEWLRQQ